MVASSKIKIIAAANAQRHEDSQRARIDRLIRTIKVVGAFKSAKRDRIRKGEIADQLQCLSVGEVRQELKRRDTLRDAEVDARSQTVANRTLWSRITRMACFRGFNAFLIMAISRWYLSVIIDFFLSGQPNDLKLGYGSTSIVLATIFGSGFAVWTHYAITKPSNKKIFDHFPKGGDVLIELWPITASWAAADHISISVPLALSRSFELKRYAFDAESWNTLDEPGQQRKVVQFALVFLLYLILVAFVSVPSTMILRRVHASMLSDEDLAIVPFYRGDKTRLHKFDSRSEIRKPGLTVSQAWGTVTWKSYFQVLRVYMQYFAINQLIQMMYWSANWKLHEIFEVDKYASTKLPCSPVGRVLPFSARNPARRATRHLSSHSEL